MDFRPPARVHDFRLAAARVRRHWNEYVTESLTEVRDAAPDGHSFFVQEEDDGYDLRELPMGWDAFPSSLGRWFGDDPEGERRANDASEAPARMVVGYRRTGEGLVPVPIEYPQQDEYCEWVTEKDGGSEFVRRVTFSSESIDYMGFLAQEDPSLGLLADVYSEMLDTTVISSELAWGYDVLVPTIEDPTGWTVRYPEGSYNEFNDLNRKHLVHCTHPDNTLRKAAMLMASASVLREDAYGEPITDAEALICASGFGDPNRASDPSIGAFVNAQVAAGREVSVANPVGVYLSDLEQGGFTDDRGRPIEGLWTVTRGRADEHMILRAVFEVPRGYDKVLLDGVPVTTGAQVARRIRMTSSVLTRERRGPAPAPRRPIARCMAHPEWPGFRAVFMSQMDWPTPPDLPATAAQAPARIDAETLRALALGAGLDGRWSRWSRWSLFGRWS